MQSGKTDVGKAGLLPCVSDPCCLWRRQTGRETHKIRLAHYQHTQCLLVSYSERPPELF